MADYATKADLQEVKQELKDMIKQSFDDFGAVFADAMHMISERFDKIEARLDRIEAIQKEHAITLERHEVHIGKVRDQLIINTDRTDQHTTRLLALEQKLPSVYKPI